jgi:hypothetical protein
VHKDRYGNFIIEPEFAWIKPLPADLSASGTHFYPAISRLAQQSPVFRKEPFVAFDEFAGNQGRG